MEHKYFYIEQKGIIHNRHQVIAIVAEKYSQGRTSEVLGAFLTYLFRNIPTIF